MLHWPITLVLAIRSRFVTEPSRGRMKGRF